MQGVARKASKNIRSSVNTIERLEKIKSSIEFWLQVRAQNGVFKKQISASESSPGSKENREDTWELSQKANATLQL